METVRLKAEAAFSPEMQGVFKGVIAADPGYLQDHGRYVRQVLSDEAATTARAPMSGH